MHSPVRRSKKIGLTQGGRVWNGKAYEKISRLFPISTWEKLSDESDELMIIRENPSKNYFHPCSPSQIRSVLDELPVELTADIRAVVLRRISKTDERRLVDARKTYQCIILNSFHRNLKTIWPYKPVQSTFKHMGLWCNRWSEENGNWILQWTHSEIRRYYLYHVLLHEVGHINDHMHKKRGRREDFAENFAFEWAEKLGQI
ncbi:MAG: hypothetical protein GY795_06980 [Desulfobacterales bacterium]|nr:hypothetical protein [Desulfobacterales bacterium]